MHCGATRDRAFCASTHGGDPAGWPWHPHRSIPRRAATRVRISHSASQRGRRRVRIRKPGNGGDPAGWPRHPHQSIPLLPSGPGGVFDLASRGADGATMETCASAGTAKEARMLAEAAWWPCRAACVREGGASFHPVVWSGVSRWIARPLTARPAPLRVEPGGSNQARFSPPCAKKESARWALSWQMAERGGHGTPTPNPLKSFAEHRPGCVLVGVPTV